MRSEHYPVKEAELNSKSLEKSSLGIESVEKGLADTLHISLLVSIFRTRTEKFPQPYLDAQHAKIGPSAGQTPSILNPLPCSTMKQYSQSYTELKNHEAQGSTICKDSLRSRQLNVKVSISQMVLLSSYNAAPKQ